jgi:TRAP transporter TAXI family solute receptor
MSRFARISVIALLWTAVLGGIAFWFGGRSATQLTIAAGPASGESFEVATAIARVVEITYPGVRVDVYETQGSGENVRLVDSGQVDLAAVQSDSRITQDVRAVATLYGDAYQLVVTNDSGIESFAELAGKRIAIPSADSGQNASFWFLAQHYGLASDELNAQKSRVLLMLALQKERSLEDIQRLFYTY